MSELLGEVHGLITRDQMHAMWPPHGERVVQGSEVSRHPTPGELVMMYLGGRQSQEDIDFLADQVFGDDEVPDDWDEQSIRFLLNGANRKVARWLRKSYKEQLQAVRLESAWIQETQEEYFGLFAKALGDIALQGVLTDDQVDVMRSRMYGPDGKPFMQEAPMTRVTQARLFHMLSSSELPNMELTYATDFSFGLIQQPIGLGMDDAYKRYARAHELIHALQGLEIYDVSAADGLRQPTATTIGHFRYPVITELDDNNDYSEVENTELAEGWVDYINYRMHCAEPRLGGPIDVGEDDSYDIWVHRVAELHRDYPDLYRAVSEASIMPDASPTNPTANKDALDNMHAHGMVLGKGGLTAWMQAKRQFNDYYNPGYAPDAYAASAMN